jgi:hypothetical protein
VNVHEDALNLPVQEFKLEGPHDSQSGVLAIREFIVNLQLVVVKGFRNARSLLGLFLDYVINDRASHARKVRGELLPDLVEQGMVDVVSVALGKELVDVADGIGEGYTFSRDEVYLTDGFELSVHHYLVRTSSNDKDLFLHQLIGENGTDFFQTLS